MKRTLVFVSVLALLGGAIPASAESGQAFDQITKFQANAELATLEPGDFTTDWQTASAPTEQPKTGGGMFGKMRAAMAQAQGAMSMMSTGLAESRYVAGNKERVDTPALQTATITDCGARTITHLDLKAKTYYVVSMDQPQQPQRGSGTRSAPGPVPTDDGTKASMTIVNAALGPKTVYGNNSSGYKSDITIVTTKADGTSNSSKLNRKEYVSNSNQLWLNCSTGQAASSAGMASMMNRYNELARALSTRKDSRFTFSSSGPALPSTLAYFEAVQFGAGSGEGGGETAGGRQGRGGGNFVVEIERNNIRTITSSDPVFSVPADFTKVNAP